MHVGGRAPVRGVEGVDMIPMRYKPFRIAVEICATPVHGDGTVLQQRVVETLPVIGGIAKRCHPQKLVST